MALFPSRVGSDARLDARLDAHFSAARSTASARAAVLPTIVGLALLGGLAPLAGCGEDAVTSPFDDAAADATDASTGTLPDAILRDGLDADTQGDDLASDLADAGDGSDATVAETTSPDLVDADTPDLAVQMPDALAPCPDPTRCWSTLAFGGVCGATALDENFASGRYNVHAFSLAVPADVAVDLTLMRTGGAWAPRLVLGDETGATLWDGAIGVSDATLDVSGATSSEVATLRILATSDRQLTVYLTGANVLDGDFGPAMPTEASYRFEVATDCMLGDGLLTPPNFDESDVDGGYFLLPDAQPSGIYTRKPDDCSRGNRLLIDVIYTVALRFSMLRPELAPIAIRDMNEGSCSTVDHATHGDGTHVDVVAGCATSVACTDDQAAIDLAKLFVDTGVVCGILFNDIAVQDEVNTYFASKYAYAPWNGAFMRTVTGHTSHFHVRVMKPDGTCN